MHAFAWQGNRGVPVQSAVVQQPAQVPPQQRPVAPQVETATHVPPWHAPRVQLFASVRLVQSASSQQPAQPLWQHLPLPQANEF